MQIVGECSGGTAVAEVGRTRPDILFLDVQMPEVDGFEVLDRLDPQRMPVVVFVTAYDRHAVRAFEVHAVDYLLKPVDADRFREALRHARARVAARTGAAGDAGVAALMQERARYPSRLLVPARGRTLVVEVATIDWIEATDYYASIHTGAQTHLLRQTMAEMERILDPSRFFRVHRSAIVNLERVREIQPAVPWGFQPAAHHGRARPPQPHAAGRLPAAVRCVQSRRLLTLWPHRRSHSLLFRGRRARPAPRWAGKEAMMNRLGVATLALLLAVPAAGAERKPYTRNVAIVVYENAQPLDWTGPYEVYNDAARFGAVGGAPAFNVYLVSKTSAPLNLQGLTVTPTHSIADAPRPDIVMFPGGPSDNVTNDPEFFAWAEKARERRRSPSPSVPGPSSSARRACSTASRSRPSTAPSRACSARTPRQR